VIACWGHFVVSSFKLARFTVKLPRVFKEFLKPFVQAALETYSFGVSLSGQSIPSRIARLCTAWTRFQTHISAYAIGGTAYYLAMV